MIFLYPDLLTGIQGQFTNQGLLIGGRHGKVLGERNSEMIAEDGLTLKEIQFVVFDEPETEAALVKSDLSTKEHLSSTPLSRDIYEAKMVDVLPSTITKAGDGVFLLTDGKNFKKKKYVLIFDFIGKFFFFRYVILYLLLYIYSFCKYCCGLFQWN